MKETHMKRPFVVCQKSLSATVERQGNYIFEALKLGCKGMHTVILLKYSGVVEVGHAAGKQWIGWKVRK